MKTLLRRALEDITAATNEEEEKTIVMKGPLSELYTRALDIAYAKDPENNDIVNNETALEAASNKKPKKKLKLKIKKGSFHEWLGKSKDEPITDKDIEKGLKSSDPHVKKMAMFAKNAKKWHHGKSKKKVATESLTENDIDTLIMESQQMDVSLMSKLSNALSDDNTHPTDNFQTVYGVSKIGLTDQTIVDVTNELVNNQEGEMILIIDATTPGTQGDTGSAPVERVIEINAALECIASAYKVPVYSSLKEFAESR